MRAFSKSAWRRALVHAAAVQLEGIASKLDRYAASTRAEFDRMTPEDQGERGFEHADDAATLETVAKEVRGCARYLRELSA